MYAVWNLCRRAQFPDDRKGKRKGCSDASHGKGGSGSSAGSGNGGGGGGGINADDLDPDEEEQGGETSARALLLSAARKEDDPVVNFVRSAGLIAGFHPDQATEACVDLALSLQLPFAVCPCCVFPDEFPQRRLDSKPVLVYAQLLEYLKRKHPNTRTATLPEFGTRGGSDRRTVVFMLRSDYTDAD